MRHRVALTVAVALLCCPSLAAELPGRYFQLLEAGFEQIDKRLAAEPGADLQALESRPGWELFPSAALVASVLYTQANPINRRYRDPKVLSVAFQVGDLLVREQERGVYTTRLNDDWGTYMWLDAYRLLENKLGEERRTRWRSALIDILTPLAADVAERQDYPWYASPFIITSPNHYSLWSSTLELAGQIFGNKKWESLGARVMHRFAAEEQTPDGYWGEHSRRGPTSGYDYLTSTAVALHWELSHDPAALEALRRSTNFHEYFTYPDGTPVETINDRNRYNEVSPWGHFGFSHFPDGRRYAEFLTGFFREGQVSIEDLGRIAQDALYFHPGPTDPIPQDQPRYSHQMSVPAGIRKTGPWVVCLSGIIDTQTISQFYLDRQANVSVFHQKLGLIVTGANSKRQPELATFSERIGEQIFHMPLSSRLQMGEEQDKLSLAYNTFFCVLELAVVSDKQLRLRFTITPTNRHADSQMTLQLCLKGGETLETGAGRKIALNSNNVELGPEEIGGWIRHNGWILRVNSASRLSWPVYPFNPYANAPETGVEHAVGALSTPLRPGNREISLVIQITD